MTQLSKLATLGLGKETTPNTYTAPTMGIPFTKADFEDPIAPLRDESVRGNDTVVQGVYPGPQHATWSIDVLAYPDLAGHFFAGTIGPDTVTAGVSTTLSASSLANATSISTAASIAAGSIIKIDSGANLEYAKVTAVSGAGPYTLTVTTSNNGSVGLLYAHNSSVAVVSATTHTFKQSPSTAIPTYSFTVYDTTQTLGYAGAKFTDLQIKIDPNAAISLSATALAFPGTTQSLASETYSPYVPGLGWTWTQTQIGTPTTRGKTLDLTIKRAGEAINSSDGTQGPREIFVGALECDGTYKAIFENQIDMNTFLNYTQGALVATISSPISMGGQSIAVTMSKSAWTTGKRDLGQPYVQADFNISGVYNTTDGGAVSVVLQNWQTTAY
jgi:hypothetical protein